MRSATSSERARPGDRANDAPPQAKDTMTPPRDHGGGLDAAIARWGGPRAAWIDLSTGINPAPYPIPPLPDHAWRSLPDRGAQKALEQAARRFWHVPQEAAVVAAPGASALIARMPAALGAPGTVAIPGPTYNEHAAAFHSAGWTVQDTGGDAQIAVHPNNPDGRLWQAGDLSAPLRVIDESFCDTTPEASLIAQATRPGTVILKSFGKFWGLAGLRLGFAIGDPTVIDRLRDALGPWPVPGPALAIGTAALNDTGWARQTRETLAKEAARLDQIMTARNATVIGGTPLFRLYQVDNAARWHDDFARQKILTRVFPYASNWLRLGLPGAAHWDRLDRL